VAHFTLRWKTRARVNVSVFNQCTDWVCVCVFLLHASGVQLAACDGHSHHTGVEGQQECVTGFVQGQRERLPCLYRVIAAPKHTHTRENHQYNQSCTFTTKHILEHGYTHSLKPNIFTSASPWVTRSLTLTLRQVASPSTQPGRNKSRKMRGKMNVELLFSLVLEQKKLYDKRDRDYKHLDKRKLTWSGMQSKLAPSNVRERICMFTRLIVS